VLPYHETEHGLHIVEWILGSSWWYRGLLMLMLLLWLLLLLLAL
jgi:hypothetical protein